MLLADATKHLVPSEELEKVRQAGINPIAIDDPAYPHLLREIPDSPQLLYCRGNLPGIRPTVAIVGTRKATDYGREVARRMSHELAIRGISIISGLALGIDATAHESAVDALGHTTAVLGSGLDHVYPVANAQLARRIVETGGCLISEFALGVQAQKFHFPVRNRIIAGLSLGIVVVEGNKDSGSLITARLGLDYNREVMAVPGDILRTASTGTNDLLKAGARPITCVDDILDALYLEHFKERHTGVDKPATFDNNQQHTQLTDNEKALLSVLEREPKHIDEIVKMSKLQVSIVNSTLSMMEMRGLVKQLGGMKYIRII